MAAPVSESSQSPDRPVQIILSKRLCILEKKLTGIEMELSFALNKEHKEELSLKKTYFTEAIKELKRLHYIISSANSEKTTLAKGGEFHKALNKRLSHFKKKLKSINKMDDSLVQGTKELNQEQEALRSSRPSVTGAVDELVKLRSLISYGVSDEVALAVTRRASSSPAASTTEPDEKDKDAEDLVKLLYFGSMFDVKGEKDSTSTMLTRTHERQRCLSHGYVIDDESICGDLSEEDLDKIASLSRLVMSRPVNSDLSHTEALRQCVTKFMQWMRSTDDPIDDSGSNITYAGLRAQMKKIMASDYVTATPEMKATSEVAAAAAGNVASFQVTVVESMLPVRMPINVEGLEELYQLREGQNGVEYSTVAAKFQLLCSSYKPRLKSWLGYIEKDFYATFRSIVLALKHAYALGYSSGGLSGEGILIAHGMERRIKLQLQKPANFELAVCQDLSDLGQLMLEILLLPYEDKLESNLDTDRETKGLLRFIRKLREVNRFEILYLMWVLDDSALWNGVEKARFIRKLWDRIANLRDMDHEDIDLAYMMKAHPKWKGDLILDDQAEDVLGTISEHQKEHSSMLYQKKVGGEGPTKGICRVYRCCLEHYDSKAFARYRNEIGQEEVSNKADKMLKAGVCSELRMALEEYWYTSGKHCRDEQMAYLLSTRDF